MTRIAAAVSRRRRLTCPIEPLEGRAYLSATVAFAPATSFVAGTAPVALTAADFNGDGHPDLAVADATAQTVNLFFGNGAGAFTAGPVLSLSAPPTAILTGDLNGDGKPDLAVATSPGNAAGSAVTVFLNNGNGTFAIGQQTMISAGGGSTEPVALAAGDLNADGHLDLVATDYANSAVSVLLGTGTGTFGTPRTYNVGAEPTAVAVADFNRDGKPDVAATDTLTAATATSTAASGGDAVMVLLGDGTGQFGTGPVTPLAAAGSNALAAGDLTGDGRGIDLAVGNADGTVSVLANNGTGAFTVTATPTVDAGSTGVAIADLNLDGHADVVTADGGTNFNSGTAAVTVIPGAGMGTVGPATQLAVGSLPSGVVVADFNGDGKPDIATADEGNGTVSILLNTTTVTPLATTTTLAVSPLTAPAASAVTLTATVTAKSASPLTGEATPTGAVNFYDGTALLGTATLAAGTATLTDATLAAGSHALTARYAADVAYAASAARPVTEVIAPTATSGPDLVASFVSVALPATVAPGEAGSVRVRLTNHGNAVAAGAITDALYLSLDPMLDPGDTPVAVRGSLAHASVRLAPGRSVVLSGTFTVPAATPLGQYLLLVAADVNGGVAEADAGNNVTASPTAYTVTDQFGTVGGRAGVSLQVADASGTVGTFRLSGPGSGGVVVGDDGVDVALSGTTAASAVTITTAAGGTFHLHDLSDTVYTASPRAFQVPLGTIRAPDVAVDGTITLDVGAGAVTLGDLSGATVQGGGIRSLSVANWASGTLSVPWIGTLRVAGAFGPTATLGVGATRPVVLQSLLVGGNDSAALMGRGAVGTILVRGTLSGSVSVTGAGGGQTAGRLNGLRVLGGLSGGPVDVYGGSIGSISVGGTVGANVRFVAGTFPKRVVLGGVPVSPASDPRFTS